MVRSQDDEMVHRRKLRMKHLEDPSYRQWSDMLPCSPNPEKYRINGRLKQWQACGCKSRHKYII